MPLLIKMQRIPIQRHLTQILILLRYLLPQLTLRYPQHQHIRMLPQIHRFVVFFAVEAFLEDFD